MWEVWLQNESIAAASEHRLSWNQHEVFWGNILKNEHMKLYQTLSMCLKKKTQKFIYCILGCVEHRSTAIYQETFPHFPTEKKLTCVHASFSRSDGCVIASYCMTVPLLLLFFWEHGGEIWCPVKSVKNCQMMKLLLFLTGWLATILFDLQFLQAQSADKNGKALIRNET